jgi:hypothetical protein
VLGDLAENLVRLDLAASIAAQRDDGGGRFIASGLEAKDAHRRYGELGRDKGPLYGLRAAPLIVRGACGATAVARTGRGE